MGSTIYADWVFTSPVLSTAEYPNIIAQLTTFVERHVFFFFLPRCRSFPYLIGGRNIYQLDLVRRAATADQQRLLSD